MGASFALSLQVFDRPVCAWRDVNGPGRAAGPHDAPVTLAYTGARFTVPTAPSILLISRALCFGALVLDCTNV